MRAAAELSDSRVLHVGVRATIQMQSGRPCMKFYMLVQISHKTKCKHMYVADMGMVYFANTEYTEF